MIGTRIPERLLKKVGKVAAALCCDRSTAVRWLLEKGLDSPSATLLFRGLRTRRPGRAVDRLIDIVAAVHRANLAKEAAERAPQVKKVKADIEVHRRNVHAEELRMAEVDRIALKEINRKR